jgi:hypothetical protein
MKTTQRSNSSASLRQQLLEGLIVEKVRHEIPIQNYFHKAGVMFTQAIESHQENYIARSYISWKQFALFITEELPKHRQYRLEEYKVKREWCREALTFAASQLEQIVIEMDRQEDEVEATGTLLDLIDEFDAPDLTPPVSVPSIQSPISLISNDEELETKRNSLRDALKILYPLESLSPMSGHAISADEGGGGGALLYPTVADLIKAPAQELRSPDFFTPLAQKLSLSLSLFHIHTSSSNFLSVYEAEIIKSIWPIHRVSIPQPQRSILSFTLVMNSNPIQYSFYRHDFQISYTAFFPQLHPDLKTTKPAIETNRFTFVPSSLHPSHSSLLVFLSRSFKMFLHPSWCLNESSSICNSIILS